VICAVFAFASAMALSAAMVTPTIAGAATAAPANTAPPTIPSSSPTVGTAKTVTTGTWTGSPTSYAYRWYDCYGASQTSCFAVGDADGSTKSYTPNAGDKGYTLDVQVTATNAGGSATITTAQTSAVLPASTSSSGKPVNTQRPVLAGSASRGSMLTLTNGTFTNATSQTETLYQCPSSGNTPQCTATANTSSTYTVGTSDPMGSYLRLDETATNAQGTSTVWSNVIGPITAASTGTGSSSAVVPSSLQVPASENPASGWTLEYGNAFGSPDLYQGGTDNTWYPGGSGNCSVDYPLGDPSQQEAYGSCDDTSVNANGLNLACKYGAPTSAQMGGGTVPSNIHYTCGGAFSSWSSFPSSAYKGFSWMNPYNSGHIIAVQYKWQLPPNYQFDPAIWGTGTYSGAAANTGDEIDVNESFGWGGSNSTAALNWSTGAYTQPTLVGGSTGTYMTYGFDPSAAMHTYTVVLNGINNTYQSYIDGSLVSSNSFNSSSPEYQSLIWNMGMRGGFSGCTGACSSPVNGFTSGSHSLVMRYVGYYEDTAHAGQGVMLSGCAGSYPCQTPANVGKPPLIAPGTTVASAAVTAAMNKKVNTVGRREAQVRATVARQAGASTSRQDVTKQQVTRLGAD
jgi:hypothetical protein